MPVAVVAVFLVFLGVAVVSGVAAVLAVGPRRPPATLLPIGAAFVALYVIGHRLGVSFGPQTTLFGFEVAVAWDIAVALAAAFAVAFVQQTAWRRRSVG